MNSQSNSFSLGDTVIGTVSKLESQGALINLGAEIFAYIPLHEMSVAEVDSPEEVLHLNQTREFLIVSDRDRDGNPMLALSIRSLEQRIAWERVRQMQSENVTVYATVYAINPGGVYVKIEGLRGFIPFHHICTDKPTADLLGTELPLKFLAVDEECNRLVLSHYRGLGIESMIEKLKVGDVVVGWIRTLKPYGAFVKLGDVSALLHISEISHTPFDAPDSVFKVHDEVKAIIV